MCLCNWLLTNKISLNSKKTEMIIFQKKGSKLNWNWNIRLNGYKLTLSDEIKYLGIYLGQYSRCEEGFADKMGKFWKSDFQCILHDFLFKTYWGIHFWYRLYKIHTLFTSNLIFFIFLYNDAVIWLQLSK